MAKKASVSMKLLIDTQGKRVLFAEAGKDCVDFLFLMLSLPVATVVRMLKNQGMGGSLANLYKSVENLNESYLQPNQRKDALLQPVPSQPYASSAPLLLLKNSSSQSKFYTCFCHSSVYGTRYFVSNDPQTVCPGCRRKMTRVMSYVAPPVQQGSSAEGGFVKGLVTYMVMDNLEVKPLSTISSIALLNKFNVKNVRSLNEKVVELGMDESISLLKASLHSDTVLTDVFSKVISCRAPVGVRVQFGEEWKGRLRRRF